MAPTDDLAAAVTGATEAVVGSPTRGMCRLPLYENTYASRPLAYDRAYAPGEDIGARRRRARA
jgi:hypothetical protein